MSPEGSHRVLSAVGLALGAAGVVGVVLPGAGVASLFLAVAWTAGFAIVLFRESDAPRAKSQNVGRGLV